MTSDGLTKGAPTLLFFKLNLSLLIYFLSLLRLFFEDYLVRKHAGTKNLDTSYMPIN